MARSTAFPQPLGSRRPAYRSPSSGERSPELSRRPYHSLHYILREADAPPARSARVHHDESQRVPPVARGFPYTVAQSALPQPIAHDLVEEAKRHYDSRVSPRFVVDPRSSASLSRFADSPPLDRARSSAWEERKTSPRSSTSSLFTDAPRGDQSGDDDERASAHAQANCRDRIRPQPGRSQTNSEKAEQRRLARQCTIEGCANYTIDRGLCFRHGGGKVCIIEGCTSSAKARGVCWRHGGSVLCTVDGCKRGAKSRGLCWSHGGGTKCSMEGCDKTTISKGLCWTHGGGKRCLFDDCKRPASEKRHNFCLKHLAQVSQEDYVFEV